MMNDLDLMDVANVPSEAVVDFLRDMAVLYQVSEQHQDVVDVDVDAAMSDITLEDFAKFISKRNIDLNYDADSETVLML